MVYITGPIAFSIPSSDNSVGRWNTPKDEFLKEGALTTKESEGSLLKDYGIDKDKIIPYHDDSELFNVATHTRAYLDMLIDRRFDELEGLFEDCIRDGSCMHDIFKHVYHKLSKLPKYKEIYQFIAGEFGNHWISYCSQQLHM